MYIVSFIVSRASFHSLLFPPSTSLLHLTVLCIGWRSVLHQLYQWVQSLFCIVIFKFVDMFWKQGTYCLLIKCVTVDTVCMCIQSPPSHTHAHTQNYFHWIRILCVFCFLFQKFIIELNFEVHLPFIFLFYSLLNGVKRYLRSV